MWGGDWLRNGVSLGFLQRILKQAIQSPKPVFPANFLTLFIGAAPVTDSYFINAQVPPRHLHRDLGFKSKPVLFDRDGLNNFPPEHFVTGFHIGKIDVGQAIREQGEQPITDRMPEVQDTMRSAAQKSRTKYDVCFALN